ERTAVLGSRPDRFPPGNARLGTPDLAPFARAHAAVCLAAALRNRVRADPAGPGPQRSSIARNARFLREADAPGLKGTVDGRSGRTLIRRRFGPPALSMNLPPYRQVLECASPLALSALVRGRKSGRGLPQSKTLAGLRPPPRGSWSQCMRKSERRLSMNRPTPNPSQEGSRHSSAPRKFPS